MAPPSASRTTPASIGTATGATVHHRKVGQAVSTTMGVAVRTAPAASIPAMTPGAS